MLQPPEALAGYLPLLIDLESNLLVDCEPHRGLWSDSNAMHLLATTACLVRPAQGRNAWCHNVQQRAWKPAAAPRRWQRAAAAAAGGSDPVAASQVCCTWQLCGRSLCLALEPEADCAWRMKRCMFETPPCIVADGSMPCCCARAPTFLHTLQPFSRHPQEEESEGLLPEEDKEIPGTYRDAMTTNTPLGKAVKGACDELDTLGELVRSPPACAPATSALPCLSITPAAQSGSGCEALTLRWTWGVGGHGNCLTIQPLAKAGVASGARGPRTRLSCPLVTSTWPCAAYMHTVLTSLRHWPKLLIPRSLISSLPASFPSYIAWSFTSYMASFAPTEARLPALKSSCTHPPHCHPAAANLLKLCWAPGAGASDAGAGRGLAEAAGLQGVAVCGAAAGAAAGCAGAAAGAAAAGRGQRSRRCVALIALMPSNPAPPPWSHPWWISKLLSVCNVTTMCLKRSGRTASSGLASCDSSRQRGLCTWLCCLADTGGQAACLRRA